VEGGGDVDSAAMAPTTMAAATADTADLVRHARRHHHPSTSVAKDPAVAFAALVRRFERTALAVAFACCGDAALAGDITQEAFLRAWRRLGDLSDEAKFGPWLCGIVRHLSADARRRGRGRHAVPLDAAGAGEVVDPAATLDRMEQADMINWALRQLDEISRTAVVLRYYENLSSVEIAELIDATPAAVDMRLSRARRTLRDLLGEPPEQASRP
jgi:RNA polymerase sigma factor (sigma-70 family)